MNRPASGTCSAPAGSTNRSVPAAAVSVSTPLLTRHPGGGLPSGSSANGRLGSFNAVTRVVSHASVQQHPTTTMTRAFPRKRPVRPAPRRRAPAADTPPAAGARPRLRGYGVDVPAMSLQLQAETFTPYDLVQTVPE